MNYDANKSFYDTVLRLSSLFFGVAVFVLLTKRDGTDAIFIMCMVFGIAPVVFLVFLKSKLNESGQHPVVLYRHVGHIMIDALNEICGTISFSFAIAIVTGPAGSTNDGRNTHFLDGRSFTLEAFVLVFILFSYLLVLCFYSNASRRERQKAQVMAVSLSPSSGKAVPPPDQAPNP